MVGIPVGPMGLVEIPLEWELGAKLLGIEMGMGSKSSRVGRNGNFVLEKFPHHLICIKFTVIHK